MSSPLCGNCKLFMLDLLNKRIRRILEIARKEARGDGRDQDDDGNITAVGHAQAQCFHLMELRCILEGQETSGVYDDYGGAKESRP